MREAGAARGCRQRVADQFLCVQISGYFILQQFQIALDDR